MSHFPVLVIGPDHDTQLAPFHEFECTGDDNEFVQNIDITDQRRTEYTTETVRRLRDATGALHSPSSKEFYRDPTPEERKKIGPVAGSFGSCGGFTYLTRDWGDGRGYRTQVQYTPEGLQEVEVPFAEAMTFREFCCGEWHSGNVLHDGAEPTSDHKYGWVRLDAAGEVVEVIDRTNPNAKWDWYLLGGRWTGFFLLKSGASGRKGRPGLGAEGCPVGYADQALKRDIDFEQMRNDAGVKARALWKMVRGITGGASWDSWDDTLARYGQDTGRARDEYRAQPAIEQLEASGKREFRFEIDDDLALDEEIYVQRARNAACVTFAFLKDGQWAERGKMGWWAAVSDEVSKAQWHEMFNRMLDALPDDTLLTLVDCHI